MYISYIIILSDFCLFLNFNYICTYKYSKTLNVLVTTTTNDYYYLILLLLLLIAITTYVVAINIKNINYYCLYYMAQ